MNQLSVAASELLRYTCAGTGDASLSGASAIVAAAGRSEDDPQPPNREETLGVLAELLHAGYIEIGELVLPANKIVSFMGSVEDVLRQLEGVWSSERDVRDIDIGQRIWIVTTPAGEEAANQFPQ